MADRTSRFWLAVVLATTTAWLVAAEAPLPSPHAEPQASGVEALSAPLRAALSAEMQAVQSGMMQVVPALAAGRWDDIAAVGTSIRDSYLMKQALTAEQLDELHHALPPDFLERDARFHADADMLRHVALARKPELVAFYHARLMEACVACHARHAASRFPDLGEPSGDGHDHGH
jgi:hypothetical protein